GNLVTRVAGQSVDKDDTRRSLVVGQVGPTVVDDGARIGRYRATPNHKRYRGLAPLRMGASGHGHLLDAGVAGDHPLELGGIDVGSAAEDEVVSPSRDGYVAIGIDAAEVTGLVPATDHRVPGRLSVVPITRHHGGRLRDQLADGRGVVWE